MADEVTAAIAYLLCLLGLVAILDGAIKARSRVGVVILLGAAVFVAWQAWRALDASVEQTVRTGNAVCARDPHQNNFNPRASDDDRR